MFLLSGISKGFKEVVPKSVRDVGGSALQNLTSGERFVNTVGSGLGIKNAGTRLGETLEKAPVGGGLLRTAFDVGAAPLTYLTAGIGPGASVGIKALPMAARLPLQFLAPASKTANYLPRLGVETALGVGGTIGSKKFSQAVDNRTDNPFLIGAAGLVGGVLGGAGAAQAAMRTGSIRNALREPLSTATIRNDAAERAFVSSAEGAIARQEKAAFKKAAAQKTPVVSNVPNEVPLAPELDVGNVRDAELDAALNKAKGGAEEAVPPFATGEVPPTGGIPPTGSVPPTSGVPPTGGTPRGFAGINAVSEQAKENIRQDAPGAAARLMYKLPLMEKFFRPGLKTPDNVLTAYNARDLALKEITTKAFGTRIPIISEVKDAFNLNNVNDKVAVKWVGDPTWDAKRMTEETAGSLTNTLYDVIQNPQLYDLSPSQLAIIAKYEGRNTGLLDLVVRDFNANIKHFDANSNGAYLPNVTKKDFAQDAATAIFNEGTATKKFLNENPSKKRTYQSARDRIHAEKQEVANGKRTTDQIFDPETDLDKLTEGMDDYKARSAGNNAWVENLNGLTKEQKDALGPSKNDYVAVKITADSDEGMRWFPKEEADLIGSLLEAPNNNWMKLAADFNSTVLSSDLSPVGVQGLLAFLQHPLAMSKTIVQGIANGSVKDVWSPEAFARDVANDSSWVQFSNGTGQAIVAGRVPSEFGGGFLRKVPKIGESLVSFNDKVFIGVLRAQKRIFDEEMIALAKSNPNMSEKQMVAIAGRTSMQIIPTANTKMAGLSDKQAASLRIPVTSPTFIQRPLQLATEGTEGLFRIIAYAGGKGFGPAPTARQQRSAAALLRFYSHTAAIASSSAALTVLAQGGSEEEAAKAALDTLSPVTKNSDGKWVTNRNFLRVQVGDYSLPLGGPMRSVMQALAPRPVKLDENTEIWVPGAGLRSYFENRVSPVFSRASQIKANKDFDGNFIVSPDTGFPQNYLQYVAYGIEGALPLTVGALGEAWRTKKTLNETVSDVAGSFVGATIQPLSDQQLIAKYANKNEYAEVTPAQREKVFEEHPELKQRISDRRFQKNTPVGVLERQKRSIEEAQALGDEQFRTGEQTLGEWKENNNKRAAQLSQAYELAFPNQKPNEKKPWTMWNQEIRNQTKGDVVDWDAVDSWRANKSDEYNQLIDENIGVARSPLQKERAAAIKQLAADDFFQMPRFRGLRALSSREVTDYMQLVENERLVDPRLARLPVGYATTKIMREAGASSREIAEVNRSRKDVMEDPAYKRYKKQNRNLIAWTNQDLTYDQISRMQ